LLDNGIKCLKDIFYFGLRSAYNSINKSTTTIRPTRATAAKIALTKH